MRFLNLALLTILVSACAQEPTAAPVSGQKPQTKQPTPRPEEKAAMSAQKPSQPQTLQFTARVVHKNLEGGFFALYTEDGRRFQPINLAGPYRRDGLLVEVTATTTPDLVTFQQHGQPVRIEDIRILDDSQVGKGDNTR